MFQSKRHRPDRICPSRKMNERPQDREHTPPPSQYPKAARHSIIYCTMCNRNLIFLWHKAAHNQYSGQTQTSPNLFNGRWRGYIFNGHPCTPPPPFTTQSRTITIGSDHKRIPRVPLSTPIAHVYLSVTRNTTFVTMCAIAGRGGNVSHCVLPPCHCH
jgi:hypothetical protein